VRSDDLQVEMYNLVLIYTFFSHIYILYMLVPPLFPSQKPVNTPKRMVIRKTVPKVPQHKRPPEAQAKQTTPKVVHVYIDKTTLLSLYLSREVLKERERA
jgi:hypothetical protein